MCDHHETPRPGSRLQDGHRHTTDHDRLSRRNFLWTLGLAAAGTPMLLGNTALRAVARTPVLTPLQSADTDRILVLIQLGGGNDGFNTVVPITNDAYYRARPTLAIQKQNTHALTLDHGFHSSLSEWHNLYHEGQMAIVQNVGYPNPDLSHFRSTDIWMSGSGSDTFLNTGWTGRYLESIADNFAAAPPEAPLAVQIGGASLLFQGSNFDMGMALSSTDMFQRLANRGIVYETSDLSSTNYGTEAAYARRVANDSFRYAGAIQRASSGTTNRVPYPENSLLAEHLAIVARLIKGDLGARIYVVSLDGFDTHAEQADMHASLLQQLSQASSAFLADLAADNLLDRTLVMTFSEFGRTYFENGSDGTDHGTGAPLFLLGPNATGGFYGSAPDLNALDDIGDPLFSTDFRAVYASILQHWFGMPGSSVDALLEQPFDRLNFLSNPTQTTREPVLPTEGFVLHANYPNPFTHHTQIDYTLDQASFVRLHVFDVQGRLVHTLVDTTQPAGRYTVHFTPERLPSGSYFYRLETSMGIRTRKMILLR